MTMKTPNEYIFSNSNFFLKDYQLEIVIRSKRSFMIPLLEVRLCQKSLQAKKNPGVFSFESDLSYKIDIITRL